MTDRAGTRPKTILAGLAIYCAVMLACSPKAERVSDLGVSDLILVGQTTEVEAGILIPKYVVAPGASAALIRLCVRIDTESDANRTGGDWSAELTLQSPDGWYYTAIDKLPITSASSGTSRCKE